MKVSPVSLPTRGMHIKTLLRYHQIHTRMTEMKNTETTRWQGCREMGSLHTLLIGMENGTATLENSSASSLKTICTRSVQPSNCSPGHLSQRNEILCSQNTYAQIFIALLFIIAKNCNQPRCLKEVHAVEYQSAVKRALLNT